MSFSQNAAYFFSSPRDSCTHALFGDRCRCSEPYTSSRPAWKLQEITLRHPRGFKAISAIKHETPGILIGAGSVLTRQQGEQAIAAGAQFLVSPGCTEELLQFAVDCSVPFLPGVATVSEIMRVQALGCDVAKLFPVQMLGGAVFLRALSGLLPFMKFCPTGGIDASLTPDYLALANVLAVGGSWMAPSDLVGQSRFSEIRRLGEQAAAF